MAGNVFPFVHPMPRTYRSMSENEQMAQAAMNAPRVGWDTFYHHFDWEQGEHVALIGPTGRGKTTFLTYILEKRNYIAVTATKPRDATMQYLISQGYQVYPAWPHQLSAKKFPRRVIWPDARKMDSDEQQRHVFKDMYDRIYVEGGWCIVIDEGFIFSEELKLKKEMRKVWSQGRSMGITQVVGSQRPRWIPTEMYDQSTHLFFWYTEDERILETMGEINGRNPQLIKGLIANLEPYQILYVDRKNRRMMRTVPPPPDFDTGR